MSAFTKVQPKSQHDLTSILPTLLNSSPNEPNPLPQVADSTYEQVSDKIASKWRSDRPRWARVTMSRILRSFYATCAESFTCQISHGSMSRGECIKVKEDDWKVERPLSPSYICLRPSWLLLHLCSGPFHPRTSIPRKPTNKISGTLSPPHRLHHTL